MGNSRTVLEDFCEFKQQRRDLPEEKIWFVEHRTATFWLGQQLYLALAQMMQVAALRELISAMEGFNRQGSDWISTERLILANGASLSCAGFRLYAGSVPGKLATRSISDFGLNK